MKLKSYFTGSVEAAISQASKELGSEAMLVYSREAPPEARHLGSYEVVFSLPSPAIRTAEDQSRIETPAPVLAAAQPRDYGGGDQNALQKLTEEVAALRAQMKRMARIQANTPTTYSNNSQCSATTKEILERMIEAGLSAELVEEIGSRLDRSPEVEAATTEPSVLWQTTRRELRAMFSVDARLGTPGEGPSIVALIGPPGSGKTTVLVKLAVVYGMKTRRGVQLLSMDMHRIGGAEQLRSYAAILGIGFQALETPIALTQALEEHRNKDLILIDTPGLSEKDMEISDEVALLLRSHSNLDTHLTLTASMKSADLKRAVDRFERFGPSKLLFTRLDETTTPGTILNETVRTGKPISFLTNGQQIPEDLEHPNKDRILDLVLGIPSEEQEPSSGMEDPPLVQDGACKHLADSQAAAA